MPRADRLVEMEKFYGKFQDDIEAIADMYRRLEKLEPKVSGQRQKLAAQGDTIVTEALRRLKPAQVGYFGRGIPDEKTMSELQTAYAIRMLESGNVAPHIVERFRRLQGLHEKAFHKTKPDKQALLEGMELAKELLPIFHFKVDDVDWEQSS